MSTSAQTSLGDGQRLPGWAEELRRRFRRGEAYQFVLHGNVQDLVFDDKDGTKDDRLVSLTEYLTHVLLERRTPVAVYNVSTGVRFVRGKCPAGSEELLLQKESGKVLPLLERAMLTTPDPMAVVIEYADTVAPAGDTSFSTQEDRAAVVALQRWSTLPSLDKNGNVVILLCENLSELHPKLVANPRVATIRVPMPDKDERSRLLQHISPRMGANEVDQMAEVTAGLKALQIRGIFAPAPSGAEDEPELGRYITELLGGGAEAAVRAQGLAPLFRGKPRDEVRRLLAPGGPASGGAKGIEDARKNDEVLRMVGARKREIIERECFGLIEFVEPKFGFEVVGGLEEVKKDLLQIARNIREGRRLRVPMGLLFTGPMGTGKTFVAEAFAKESGLTAIKLKNFRSKWVGATEGNLERILQVVQAIGQVMVIIDEGDRAFGNQGEEDGGTSSRVIGRIKEFMSDTANRGRVLFVLMTNRPDKLDVDIKRAGRLDRKIPFLYPQTAEEVELIVLAQLRKNKVQSELRFPQMRDELFPMVGYSNADIEAVVLLASDYAGARVMSGEPEREGPQAPRAADPGVAAPMEFPVTSEDLLRAIRDYLPSRDTEMLEYMELLAVFEASNRRMLPRKYADVKLEDLQARLQELKQRVGSRR